MSKPEVFSRQWKVDTENFEGPLDLLLHLIRSRDLDIYDIPIAEITSEYLKYLEIIKNLNIDNAGEFIVMAAVLMRIKSRMLLPSEDPESEEEESAEDMRRNLIERLIEYKRFKEAAGVLSDREERYSGIFPLQQYPVKEFGQEVEATLFDLLDAFRELVANAREDVKDIITEEISVEDKIRYILSILEKGSGRVEVEKFIENKRSVMDIIVTLLALLELARMRQIKIIQPVRFGKIFATGTGSSEPEPAPGSDG